MPTFLKFLYLFVQLSMECHWASLFWSSLRSLGEGVKGCVDAMAFFKLYQGLFVKSNSRDVGNSAFLTGHLRRVGF
jgi:hypothetical protein